MSGADTNAVPRRCCSSRACSSSTFAMQVQINVRRRVGPQPAASRGAPGTLHDIDSALARQLTRERRRTTVDQSSSTHARHGIDESAPARHASRPDAAGLVRASGSISKRNTRSASSAPHDVPADRAQEQRQRAADESSGNTVADPIRRSPPPRRRAHAPARYPEPARRRAPPPVAGPGVPGTGSACEFYRPPSPARQQGQRLLPRGRFRVRDRSPAHAGFPASAGLQLTAPHLPARRDQPRYRHENEAHDLDAAAPPQPAARRRRRRSPPTIQVRLRPPFQVLTMTGTTSPSSKPRPAARNTSAPASAGQQQARGRGGPRRPARRPPARSAPGARRQRHRSGRRPRRPSSSRGGAPARPSAARRSAGAEHDVAAWNASSPGSRSGYGPVGDGGVTTTARAPWRHRHAGPLAAGHSVPKNSLPTTESIATPVEARPGPWTTARARRRHVQRNEAAAIAMPIANQREANSARALAQRLLHPHLRGACRHQRCLHRKPNCVATAHSSASPIPNSKSCSPFDCGSNPRRQRVRRERLVRRLRGQRCNSHVGEMHNVPRRPLHAVPGSAQLNAQGPKSTASLSKAPCQPASAWPAAWAG